MLGLIRTRPPYSVIPFPRRPRTRRAHSGGLPTLIQGDSKRLRNNCVCWFGSLHGHRLALLQPGGAHINGSRSAPGHAADAVLDWCVRVWAQNLTTVLGERAYTAHLERVHASEIQHLLRSKSWRLTRPLRLASRLASGVQEHGMGFAVEHGIAALKGGASRRQLDRPAETPRNAPVDTRTPSITPDTIIAALSDRLGTLLEHFDTAEPTPVRVPRGRTTHPAPPEETTPLSVGRRLVEAAGRAATLGTDEAAWLLAIAISGVYPQEFVVRSVRRIVDIEPRDLRVTRLLDLFTRLPPQPDTVLLGLQIVESATLVDVDYCSREVFSHGSMQRIVRAVVPEWHRTHPALQLVGWSRDLSALITLTPTERARVLAWEAAHTDEIADPQLERDTIATRHIVAPVRSTLLFVEGTVPLHRVPVGQSPRLTPLASDTTNRTVVLGYGCAPIPCAPLVSAEASEVEAKYLSFVKHADLVLAMSDAVAEEFHGFIAALKAQGIQGPTCIAVPLPTVAPVSRPEDAPDTDGGSMLGLSAGVPGSVLSVGQLEPRKNQRALIHAAEVLWREGLMFPVRIVGTRRSDAVQPGEHEIEVLKQRGRDIQVIADSTDVDLAALYAQARVTVYTPLQEGCGLPVIESLSAGTPAITTNYGTTAEIAQAGGCLEVDPRDDEVLVTALRRVLTEDALVRELRDAIGHRPERTWRDYATALWVHASGVVRR